MRAYSLLGRENASSHVVKDEINSDESGHFVLWTSQTPWTPWQISWLD